MPQWNNWAGDETCAPAQYLQPRSVDEVAAIVRNAAETGATVRVVGAGHSFNDAVSTDGVLLNLDRLCRIRSVDADAGLVTVDAGIRLYELNPALAAYGLALPNLGDIDRQSIAGAISTATHGTGAKLGNLATQVEALELVTAAGNVVTLQRDDDRLRAARVSIGALGVITAVTLRVVPAFNLHALEQPMRMGEVLARLDEFVDENDHFEFFVFPHAGTALTKRNNRTPAQPRPVSETAQRINEFFENSVVESFCRIGKAFPARIPALNQAITGLASGSNYIDASYRVFASRRSVRFTEMELALPREAAPQALRDVQLMIERKKLAVNFPLEVRFVAGDTASLLSPSYDRDTCYIAVHMYRGMPWREYFRAVQDVGNAYAARAHWGKRHLLAADDLAGLYPGWGEFQSVRAALDPQGVFANGYVDRVLGPVTAT